MKNQKKHTFRTSKRLKKAERSENQSQLTILQNLEIKKHIYFSIQANQEKASTQKEDI